MGVVKIGLLFKILTMQPLKNVIHFYMNPFNRRKVLMDDEQVLYLWEIDVSEGGYVNITVADLQCRNIDTAVDDGWRVYNDDEDLGRIKLMLVPMLKMTAQHRQELQKIKDTVYIPGYEYQKEIDVCRFLTDNDYDVFDLIFQGVAVDKTTYLN
jgi:hypothetical protein